MSSIFFITILSIFWLKSCISVFLYSHIKSADICLSHISLNYTCPFIDAINTFKIRTPNCLTIADLSVISALILIVGLKIRVLKLRSVKNVFVKQNLNFFNFLKKNCCYTGRPRESLKMTLYIKDDLTQANICLSTFVAKRESLRSV